MQVTEVRVEVIRSTNDRLRGFCTVVFDQCFIVRDIRILEGPQGLFVAMPSRKRTAPCPRCRNKNVVQANYCNNCGGKLDPAAHVGIENPHVDVAHPINATFRSIVTNAVLTEYRRAAGEPVEGQNAGAETQQVEPPQQ